MNRLEKSLSLKTSEVNVARGIDDEHALKWWVPCTLSRRDRIISGVNKRIRRVTYKHGVELPTSLSHAKKLDDMNDNTI